LDSIVVVGNISMYDSRTERSNAERSKSFRFIVSNCYPGKSARDSRTLMALCDTVASVYYKEHVHE
jgi:hypothetical protein